MPASASQSDFQLAFRIYKPKIDQWVNRNVYKLPGQALDPEDVRQEMYLVLLNVCEKYDPNKGAKFNTLFWSAVGNRFRSMLRAGSTDRRRSNIRTATLERTAVRQAINMRRQAASAEDEALARIEIDSVPRSRQKDLEVWLAS